MSFADYMTLFAILFSAFAGSIGGVWALAWWLAKKFEDYRALLNSKINNVLDKLEEHEQLDIKRFQDIRDDIWLMRVRNAARDGIVAGHSVADNTTVKPTS